MRFVYASFLCLALSACCVPATVETLIETEIGAQERDLKDWDTLSDDQQRKSADQTLKALKELKKRLVD